MVHAGGYAAALHYLKAVADMGVAAAKASGVEAVDRMKAMPTDDDAFGPGTHPRRRPQAPPRLPVRGEDAGEPRPLGLLQAGRDHPGEEAFRPLAEGGCPLVRA